MEMDDAGVQHAILALLGTRVAAVLRQEFALSR